MRGMFGLVSLLLAALIIAYLWSQHTAVVAHEGKKAQDEARQISGRGQDGRAAINSFTVNPEMKGNRLDALEVTDVVPGGALADYGLKKGDKIIKIGDTTVGNRSNDDPELAKAQVHEAYQRSESITVLRKGQEVMLPIGGGSHGTMKDLIGVDTGR